MNKRYEVSLTLLTVFEPEDVELPTIVQSWTLNTKSINALTV